MRGLNVYCCPTCGHYGFFQLVANAVCPHCSIAMTPLPIPYQDFMDLDYPQRQVLISRHMINATIPLDAKAKSADKAKSLDKNRRADKTESPANKLPAKAKAAGQAKPSERSKSLDDTKSSDETAAPDNTKWTDRPAAPGKTKSSGRTYSLNKSKSADNRVTAASTMSPDKLESPDSTVSPDKPASTSLKLHPDISKDSDKETLYQEVLALREKNEQLEQTVSWMHDLIWELTLRLHITQNT